MQASGFRFRKPAKGRQCFFSTGYVATPFSLRMCFHPKTVGVVSRWNAEGMDSLAQDRQMSFQLRLLQMI
jgi:hypothetical protein